MATQRSTSRRIPGPTPVARAVSKKAAAKASAKTPATPPAKTAAPSAPTSLAQALQGALADDATRSGPAYQRLAGGLRDAIAQGLLHSGSSLPPERDLAQELGVSRETVRRAVELLTTEGLLRGRQGSGTYVCTRIVEPLSLLASFSEDMARRGFKPSSTWLSREIGLPTNEEALSLGLSLSDPVMRCARVRLADGAPLAIERATVSAAWVGGTIDFGDSLYAALRRHGAAPVRAMQRIRADAADAQTARWLKLDLNAPVLDIERRSFTQEGRPVELTRSTYRGDLYDYVVEMRVAPTPAV